MTDFNKSCLVSIKMAGASSEVADFPESAAAAIKLFDPYRGCIGHWKLEENVANTDVADSSPEGNNGVSYRNTNLLHTSGHIDDAFLFTPASWDYIISSDLSSYITNKITIAAWIYPTSAEGNWQGIAGLHTACALLFIKTNQLVFDIQNTSSERVIAYKGTIINNQWQFVVGVYNGSKMYCYINGIYAGEENQSGNILNPGAARIGNSGYPPPDEYFAGKIDDVRIFNRALSAEEVLALYHESFPHVASEVAEFLESLSVGVDAAAAVSEVTEFSEALHVQVEVILEDGADAYLQIEPNEAKGNYRIADDDLEQYELYRGVDAEPDLAGSPWEMFAALPHDTAVLDADHKYYFVLRLRNKYGLCSQNVVSWSVELDGDGDVIEPSPIAPQNITIAPAAGGKCFVTAQYLYDVDDDDYSATHWLIYLTDDGVDPDPDVDVPTVVAMRKNRGMARLKWTSPAANNEDTLKVLIRTRRVDGEDNYDSTNTDVYTCTASTIGPDTPEARGFLGDESQVM